MKIIHTHPDGWGFAEKDGGATFTPWGCNYYDPFTGWPPRIWEQFDAGRVSAHFDDIRAIGGNVIRVFTSLTNLLKGPRRVSREGVAKMERMLELAGGHGIRVIWSGPGQWEGAPAWWREQSLYEGYARPDLIGAQQAAWRGIAKALKGHPALFSYELHNEPFSPWKPTPAVREAWSRWRARHAPGAPQEAPFPAEPLAADWNVHFQRFREHVADEYVKRMTEAIRSQDDTHMVTIGLHQKSAPFDWYPPDPYAAFNPHRLAPLVDYTSVHYYPHHAFHPNIYRDPYETEEGMRETLWHARAVVRYMRSGGKPVVLEECGWYGGGSILLNGREHPERTERDQVTWCKGLVEATKGDACGWLFWPYRDTPSSLDSSKCSGFYTPEGRLKEWGREFAAMAPGITGSVPAREPGTMEQPVDWAELVTNPEAVKVFRRRYLADFSRGATVNFPLREA